MPSQKTAPCSPEAEQIAKEIKNYPLSFQELLKYLMKKRSETIESMADKMPANRRTINRLRSPNYRPTLDDIRNICRALELNAFEGQQLLSSGGFNIGTHKSAKSAEYWNNVAICFAVTRCCAII